MSNLGKSINIFSELPPWSRGVIAVIVIGGVCVLGYVAYNKIKEEGQKKDSDKVSDSAWDEYKKLVKKGERLSFPESKYLSAANTIKTSLDGCETYMGEYDAFTAVKDSVKKPIDWYFLVKVFGARSLDNCGLGTGDTTYALPELLREQLGTPLTLDGFTKTYFNHLQTYLKGIGVEL